MVIPVLQRSFSRPEHADAFKSNTFAFHQGQCSVHWMQEDSVAHCTKPAARDWQCVHHPAARTRISCFNCHTSLQAAVSHIKTASFTSKCSKHDQREQVYADLTCRLLTMPRLTSTERPAVCRLRQVRLPSGPGGHCVLPMQMSAPVDLHSHTSYLQDLAVML